MTLAHFLKLGVQPNQTTSNLMTMKKRFTSRQLCILSCAIFSYFLVIVIGILYADQLSVSL